MKPIDWTCGLYCVSISSRLLEIKLLGLHQQCDGFYGMSQKQNDNISFQRHFADRYRVFAKEIATFQYLQIQPWSQEWAVFSPFNFIDSDNEYCIKMQNNNERNLKNRKQVKELKQSKILDSVVVHQYMSLVTEQPDVSKLFVIYHSQFPS